MDHLTMAGAQQCPVHARTLHRELGTTAVFGCWVVEMIERLPDDTFLPGRDYVVYEVYRRGCWSGRDVMVSEACAASMRQQHAAITQHSARRRIIDCLGYGRLALSVHEIIRMIGTDVHSRQTLRAAVAALHAEGLLVRTAQRRYRLSTTGTAFFQAQYDWQEELPCL